MAAAAHPQEPWNKAQFDKDNRIPAAQYELLNSLPGWGNLSTVRARSPEALREPLAGCQPRTRRGYDPLPEPH